MKCIYLVIPCYNEEEVLEVTASKLFDVMSKLISNEKISHDSKICFVDDGSKDSTWNIISSLNRSDNIFSGVKLSCNKGHQNALIAGLLTVKDNCDAAISLDADLQDDVLAIEEMVERFNDGFDIVYGVRNDRKNDNLFKKITAEGYYKFLKLIGVEITYNHADYRLMSKRALVNLENFGEVNLFLRGIIPMIGFKSTSVYYQRMERAAGNSKYPLRKMLAFAFEGITSLSIKPIRAITFLGFFIFLVSVIMLIYSVHRYFSGETVAGWASTVVSIWAIGGLQLLSIGIIGEYIGKIYLETKRRPRYIIEEIL